MKIAVIGIGQSFRGDDAAGLEAVRRWREQFSQSATRPEVAVEAGGLPGLNLLDLLTDVDAAILVDAVRSSAPAGTLHHLEAEQLASFTGSAQSAHGWGVAETLALANELNLNPGAVTIRILGIEAGPMELGAGLSLEVEETLPAAASAIEAILQSLLN